MFEDLRSFLRSLEEKGDLVRITRAVSPRYEIAAGIRKTSDINGPAPWFENVTGHSMPVIGGLYASRRRAVRAFEATEAEIHDKFMRGLRGPVAPRFVADGPCKEVILKGKDADFSRLPICTHNLKDAGPYITMGLGFARHPQYGNNVSISRIQIFDGQTAGVRSLRPQHLGIYFDEAEKRGEALQLAITIGNDPYVTFCSQISGSLFLDELGVAGGWMGKPLELIKCETIEVAVPATSEIIIEGELIPGERRLEGPFGEFPGYYQGVADQAIFKLMKQMARRTIS